MTVTTIQTENPEHSMPAAIEGRNQSGEVTVHARNAVHRSSGRYYRPELDALRFLAFFLVFLTHTLPSDTSTRAATFPTNLLQFQFGLQRFSVFGLSLFFTLSAYLISELLFREREATGTILVRQFYVRRILRIWPLYFAGLSIGLLIAILLRESQSTFIWTAWAVVLLGNWFVVFNGFPGNVMFPLWSISVEEQFYLVAPWAVKFLNRRSLAVFCVALIVIANLELFFLGSRHAPDRAIWYNSFVQFETFAAGIILCLLLHGRSWRASRSQRLLLIAAWVVCWCVSSYSFHVSHAAEEALANQWSLMCGYGLVALGCCLLLLAFLGIDGRLLPRSIVYLGRISYGLYVFHMLAVHIIDKIFSYGNLLGNSPLFLRWIAALGLTILIASISYRYFETPFLRMKKRHEVIESRPV